MSSEIKVMATKPGYLGDQYRRVGDVFMVDEDQFSKEWMKKDEAAPLIDHSPEAEKARREEAAFAVQDLGHALAGNPEAGASTGGAGDMGDDQFAAYYEEVMGKKPAANAKRETLQKQIDDKLNAD